MVMAQVIGWLIAFTFVGLMFWALVKDDQKKRNRTAAEYERDLVDSRQSLLRAGLLELDKFVGDATSKRAAIEYLKDEEEGMHKTGSKGDDEKRTLDKGGEEVRGEGM